MRSARAGEFGIGDDYAIKGPADTQFGSAKLLPFGFK